MMSKMMSNVISSYEWIRIILNSVIILTCIVVLAFIGAKFQETPSTLWLFFLFCGLCCWKVVDVAMRTNGPDTSGQPDPNTVSGIALTLRLLMTIPAEYVLIANGSEIGEKMLLKKALVESVTVVRFGAFMT